MIRATLALLAIPAIAAASTLEEVGKPEPETELKPATDAAKRKFGPKDVEVVLRDGSRIRGEISGFESVALKTRYGTLTIPIAEIHAITHGKRGSDKNAVATALKDLTGDDAIASAKAAKVLQDMGSGAVDALFDARAKASGSARARIDAVLKTVLASAAPAEDSRDSVSAAKFSGSGTIDLGEFKLASKFGDLKLNYDNVERIRWLAAGGEATVKLEATDGMRDWTDTGMEVLKGDTVQISATGQINVFSTQSSPDGSNNLNNRQFLGGALIGRFGEDGEPFLIGSEKRLTASTSGKLYLRIYLNDDLLPRAEVAQATGSYTVHATSGPRAGSEP